MSCRRWCGGMLGLLSTGFHPLAKVIHGPESEFLNR